MPSRPPLLEIFLVALRLGCTSFGGPVAHLGFFHREYVEKRKWLDEAHYADLVALCQFLPGPASSQVGFGVGCLRRGIAGGLAAWLGFTLPSAALMIAFGYGLEALGPLVGAGWLRGLKAVAVAVVAQAVWQMGRKLCPDVPRAFLAGVSAGLAILLPQAWSQVAIIAIGAALGWAFGQRRIGGESNARGKVDPTPPSTQAPGPALGTALLVVFAGLLVGLPLLVQATSLPAAMVAEKFYRSGSLVFGGGHVLLPLLEREVVAPGWLTHDQFLAGYGAAQALPGPLFSFSAYLGTVMNIGPGGALGGIWALVTLFLPSLLLVAGTLPFWQLLRHRVGAQAALRGANAAVVGLLLAALYHPVGTSGLIDARSWGLAVAALVALQSHRLPVWAIVSAAAGAGALLWR